MRGLIGLVVLGAGLALAGPAAAADQPIAFADFAYTPRTVSLNAGDTATFSGDFTSHPAATADIDALAEADVIVIGLKAHSLPELAPAIGERLRPGAMVVPAQNGLPWW